MNRDRRHLTVDLSVEDEPMTGTVRAEHGAERQFAGWLGLVSALDAAIRRRPEPALKDERDQERKQ